MMQNLTIDNSFKNVVFFGGSDFHLENHISGKDFEPKDYLFGTNTKLLPDNFNVCLLAGDICTARKTARYTSWFEVFCDKFDLVIYVDGNHEHWRGYVGQNTKHLKNSCSHITNLIFLDNSVCEFEVEGRSFVIMGTTLWSDIHQNDLETNIRLSTKSYTNAIVKDFSKIRVKSDGSYKPLRLHNYHNLHRQSVKFIEEQSERYQGKDIFKVLVTHHSPTLLSIPNYYPKEYIAFDATPLEGLLCKVGFDIVLHGHLHRDEPLIVDIDSKTTVYSNPRGDNDLKNTCGYKLLNLREISLSN